MENQRSEPNSEKDGLKPLIFLCLAIAILWLGSFILVYFNLNSWADRSNFGGTFGSINALFSGLAFAGIIYTILLQRRELSLQRRELAETRKVFQEQSATFKSQQFENTFFQLMQFHNEIVKGMDVEINTGREVTGVDCFRNIYIEFSSSMLLHMKMPPNDWIIDREYYLWLEGLFDNIYTQYSSDLSRYFRSLFNLLNFIDKSEVNDPIRYGKFVKAQLSSYESLLLFYYELFVASSNHKNLISKYTLLEDIEEERLINSEDRNLSEFKT